MSDIPAGTWAIDPIHSSFGFEVKHLGVSTYRGSFPGVEGAIETTDGAVTSVAGTARIDSLVTQDVQLTGHLMSPDFFDQANHPTGTFASTSIVSDGNGKLKVVGTLTLRGVTQPVELAGELEGVGPDGYGNTRIGISAAGFIDRTKFGLSWNVPLGDTAVAVGEKVKLVWNAEGIKQ
jgi:polyisoprenoid-binding protein YceI